MPPSEKFPIYSICLFLGRRQNKPPGIPNQRMHLDNRTQRVGTSLLWTAHEAAQLYRQSGGQLTDEGNFGDDPLVDEQFLCEIRDAAFKQRHPNMDTIFHSVVNGNSGMFKDAFQHFHSVTVRLSATLAH